jgi:recombination protein RecA
LAGRKRITKETGGNYFIKDKSNLEFISSGCLLLDLVLGGGWALGRISNVVGDNSSGKTLIAIEACANFANQYPEGQIYYHETEAAFDTAYAESLGMPLDKIIFVRDIHPKGDVVEGWFDYLKKELLPSIKKSKKNPILYIMDTQDALGCDAEKKREVGEGSYNQEKNQILNRLYRELTDPLKEANVHLMVVSQTRDNIGVTFGRKWRVTGEGSLKFFASQRLQLAEVGKMKKTIRNVERPYGIKVRANCFKNKVGPPFRTCDFPIYFGYGIDGNEASLNFLREVKVLEKLSIKDYNFKEDSNKKETSKGINKKETSTKRITREINKLVNFLRNEGNLEIEKEISDLTKKMWNEIEIEFMPKRSKY